MKKVVLLFITLTMFITCVALPVNADVIRGLPIGDEYIYIHNSADGSWSYDLNTKTNEVILLYYNNAIDKGTDLKIPETVDGYKVTAIYSGVLDDLGAVYEQPVNVHRVIISKNVKTIYMEPVETGRHKISEYIVDPENEYFTSKDGVLYTKDMKVLVAYPDESPRKKYVMPNSVKDMHYLKFADNLETLVLSDNLTGITNAFAGCKNLKTVKMGNKIKFISEHAFQNNKKLKNVNMPKKLKEIWRMAFFGCRKIKKLTFSKNIKAIDEETFGNCKSLSKVTFNSKKKAPKIGINAFKGTKKGIKFYVKNKKVAKSLKKQLKNSGAKSARIIIK